MGVETGLVAEEEPVLAPILMTHQKETDEYMSGSVLEFHQNPSLDNTPPLGLRGR